MREYTIRARFRVIVGVVDNITTRPARGAFLVNQRRGQPIDDDKRRCDTGGGGVLLRRSRASHSSSYLCLGKQGEGVRKERDLLFFFKVALLLLKTNLKT